MRESVIFENQVSTGEIPADQQYLDGSVPQRVSGLIWAEHCTECAWPTCYSSCSLYTPRTDLKCRRFKHGIEEVLVKVDGRSQAAMRVSFNKWGKLEAEGSVRMVKPAQMRRVETLDRLVGKLVPALPVSFDLKTRLVGRWNRMKRHGIFDGEQLAESDQFVIECLLESPTPLQLKLRILPVSGTPSYFEDNIWLRPGHNYTAVEAAKIARFLKIDQPLRLQLEPAEQPPEPNRILFTRLEFVRRVAARPLHGTAAGAEEPKAKGFEAVAAPALPKAKCVVWDLDNTLWDGTLVELGPLGIRLRPEVARIVVELDRRGVLQSVASKNNFEESIVALKQFGLAEYLLYPQIHWYPKSQSIKQIAASLNIGLDTFFFIDDEPFELGEVSRALPMVRTVGVTDIANLLQRPEFDLPATQESQRRRFMYREEEQRSIAFSNSAQDFLTFLASCELVLELSDISEKSMQRVFELTQRTNQLNYRGRQLSRLDLERLHTDGQRRGIVMSCRDRFGDYGIVGFVVLDETSRTIEDFFMSCRVQRKKVEQALMSHLRDAVEGDGKLLRVHYKRSKRNAPALEVLSEMRFERIEGDEEEAIFLAPPEIEDRDIVSLKDNTQAGRAAAFSRLS
jgi:FkbH-like protein